MRHLRFLLLRLSRCIARNAKFISLGKQQGNKYLIVVTGIYLRRGRLQLSAFSCASQTHLTLGSKGPKKRGSPGMHCRPKLPILISLPFKDLLSHVLSPAISALVIDFTDTASENHTCSGYLIFSCLPKCPRQV